MSIAELPRKMTTEELLAMPDDGVERWLIRGELRENRDIDMNRRRPDHGRTCSSICFFLKQWARSQPATKGGIYSGDTMFRLTPVSNSTVGIDVAYISPELEAQTARGADIVDGPPVIAVEVLSPSDKVENIAEKVWEYLDAGVAQVWVADPSFDLVTVHRKNAEPISYSRSQELAGEPELPGFRVRVAELFD